MRTPLLCLLVLSAPAFAQEATEPLPAPPNWSAGFLLSPGSIFSPTALAPGSAAVGAVSALPSLGVTLERAIGEHAAVLVSGNFNYDVDVPTSAPQSSIAQMQLALGGRFFFARPRADLAVSMDGRVFGALARSNVTLSQTVNGSSNMTASSRTVGVLLGIAVEHALTEAFTVRLGTSIVEVNHRDVDLSPPQPPFLGSLGPQPGTHYGFGLTPYLEARLAF